MREEAKRQIEEEKRKRQWFEMWEHIKQITGHDGGFVASLLWDNRE